MERDRKPSYLTERPEIKVKHSGLVYLQEIKDYPDGNLYVGEEDENIPFPIKRFYFINALFYSKAQRGKHAHKTLKQAIFCINGIFELHLDDGENKQDVIIDTPGIGVFLGPRLWHRMTHFSPDCVILVVASAKFDKSDYIRDYQEFLNYIKDTHET